MITRMLDGERIRDRASGWEAAWAGLAGRVGEVLRSMLRRQFCSLGHWQDAEALAEAVASDILAGYHERAVAGTLLALWEPGKGDPARFLCGRWVYARALDALRQQTGRQLPLDAQAVAPAGSDGRQPAAAAILDAVTDGPLHLLNPDPPTVAQRSAGAEVWGRLDWEDPALQPLRRELAAWCAGAGWAACAEAWRSGREAAARELAELRERGGAGGALEARLAEAEMRLHFHPLDGPTLARLAGTSPNNGEQMLSRYRRQLPQLFAEVAEALRRWQAVLAEEAA